MLADGLLERFPSDELYVCTIAGHAGRAFSSRPGPQWRVVRFFDIVINGRGVPAGAWLIVDRSGHRRLPHRHGPERSLRATCLLPIWALSVTKIEGGDAYNVIPEQGAAWAVRAGHETPRRSTS
jgi:hypothetical protein